MATELAAPVARQMNILTHKAPFRLGQKQVFLPKFKVTLLHTPKVSPYYATFLVPLSLNKLDFRDYLYNGYGVAVHSVTSRILDQPISLDGNPAIERPLRGRYYKPQPIKKMTVRLEKPFVWPEAPSEQDLADTWDKTGHDAANEAQREYTKGQRKRDTFVDVAEREEMSKQAKRLLEGKEKWRPPRGKKDGSWAVRKEE